jgi:hypothetical protein
MAVSPFLWCGLTPWTFDPSTNSADCISDCFTLQSALMSVTGQSRRFRDVGDESGSPLRTDVIGSIG